MGKQKGEGGGRSRNRASSSQAASLVQGSGVPAVGFGGYLGGSRIQPAPSSSSSDAALLPDVDSEVLQHLKRLGRKDPTTKLKALTTLSVLFAQRPVEEILRIVPQWAFEYKKLLLDYNREVRRATHESMASLATSVKKGLAPHLKSLMGPWWFSQFDPAPEVAQAARHSFEAAFPQSERRLDALMLCVKEIILYLDENLKLTTQALSDKATPMDELEDMHQRVISSSLLAIATLIDILLGVKLQNFNDDSANTENKTLSKVRSATLSSAETTFSTHRYFLDLMKSKSAVVRSATYSLLTSYMKHIPHVFNEETMKTISSAVLGAFQEKDASCHSSMWDMILLFSRKFPEGWSYCNFQKVVLGRFLHFLRNGCYGSKQVSYPFLVQFLESIPFKAVAGERLAFDFLQNLWAGRIPQHLSAADSLAFCSAFKQCFLWLLKNESRYSGGDSSNDISVKLLNDILATLLWHDYLLLSLFINKDVNLKNLADELPGDYDRLSDEKSPRAAITHYPIYYLQDLGKVIIEILAEISLMGNQLLQVVCESLKKDCLEIIQQGQHYPKFNEHVEQVVSFFLSLDQLVLQKGQTWPLDCLARPLVVESLAAIKSMNSPSTVKLLLVLVQIFGPCAIFLKNTQSDETSKTELYLHLFNEDFIPWCLDGHNSTSTSKIDLLLSLILDEYFFDQWCSIIRYTTVNQVDSSGTETSQSMYQFELLALMLQKVRERITKGEFGNLQKYGSLPEHWHHALLDSAAVSVSCSSTVRLSDARFLCAALGGSAENDRICFLSAETVTCVLGNILKSLSSILMLSTFDWARSSYVSLLSTASEHVKHLEEPYLSTSYEMAQFAYEVLEGSIFCPRILDSILLPSILAALFIIEWECSMALAGDEENDPESRKDDIGIGSISTHNCGLEDCSDEKLFLKVNLVERIHAFRQSLSPAFWSSLNSCTLARLGNILVHSVRSAVFETRDLGVHVVSVLCSKWVTDMLKVICLDHTELQNWLDLLLSEGKYWPLWVKPSLHNGSVSVKIQFELAVTDDTKLIHDQFVAFVDKLILSLGFSEVILGTPEVPHLTASESTEAASALSSFSRAWLAAEILFTWKWQGGSVLSSFLPSLIQDMRTEAYVSDGSIVHPLLDILLDGALMHGTSQWMFFNAWHLSDNEVEKINDRFLRALVALLFTLNVKDNNIWRRSDAVAFFECVSSKLFIGSTVNKPCLRVLPFVMSVTIKSLFKASEFDQASSKIDLVGKNILSWLDAAISCLLSNSGQILQEDVEDWMQVVLSCFPLRVIGGVRKLEVEIEREINNAEKSLLLTLFRRYQIFYNSLSFTPSAGETTRSKTVQLMEAKLTAVIVGYCWKELVEDDWYFVFGRVRNWIESTVLLMEEMAEDVDKTVLNHKSAEDMSQRLILVVGDVDLLTIRTAEAALITLCLLTHLEDIKEIEEFQNMQTIRTGKYAENRDQMVESILRLFLATGVCEATVNSCGEEAASIIASSRLDYLQFWELVASFVNNSSLHIRSSAVESMELWGLSKGSVSGLYAILFSSRPISHMQFAAYSLLLSEPLRQLSIVKGSSLEGNVMPSQESELGSVESTSQETFYLTDELSTLLELPAAELLKTDLVSQDRINVFIAWTLLLSHLQLLASSSTTREKLIQYIQDKISSSILDCIFQHIPLKTGAPSGKKKDAELSPDVAAAAKASKHAIVTCSLLQYVESLWPLSIEHMASLAGAMYGMMIRLLPSYVRTWFTSLRDRSLSYSIESFTRAWCSPPLLSDEFSQVKDTVFADDNFSVSVNRSAYEIVATYKKEETGMDLVIRLPSCYPLRHVDVECTRSLGISEVKQRKWLLSLTAFVRNQNGAIAEAIRTWKSNFDKEFEGVEECPICYSILHTSNHSLPRLACKTCRHKFHAACLYKWFSTSNKSTCPLCQTPF